MKKIPSFSTVKISHVQVLPPSNSYYINIQVFSSTKNKNTVYSYLHRLHQV